MVSRNIKSKYGRSFVGLGWTVLSPFFLAMIYYFVFKKIMRVEMEHYLAFILSGVLPWSFFSQCVLEGMDSIVGNAGLVGKIPLPLQVFPLVNAVTNLVTLSASLPVMLGASLFQGVPVGFHTLFVIYFFVILFLIAYAIGLILSVGYVLFRDLRHIMTLLIQLWMFATPVIYSYDMIPAGYRWIVHLNPVADAILGIHRIFTQGVLPTQDQVLYSFFWGFLSVGGGVSFMRFRFSGILEKL